MDFFSGLKMEIEEAGKLRVGTDWNYRQFNPFAKIYFIEDGEGIVKIGQRELNMRPGGLYLIPAYIPLLLECRTFMNHYWVHFHLGKPGSVALMDFVGEDVERFSEDPEAVSRQFDILVEAFETDQPRLQLQAQGNLRLLLSDFIPEGYPEINREIKEFLPTIKFISENLDEDLSNTQLADLHGWHPTYFANRFSRAFGTSPRNYVIRKRIETARHLLWQEPLSVAETAKRVGFANPYYFSRVFKQLTGISPAKYREGRRI